MVHKWLKRLVCGAAGRPGAGGSPSCRKRTGGGVFRVLVVRRLRRFPHGKRHGTQRLTMQSVSRGRNRSTPRGNASSSAREVAPGSQASGRMGHERDRHELPFPAPATPPPSRTHTLSPFPSVGANEASADAKRASHR